jgi:FMN phosphatase YigB (HAD superfamily)
VEEIRVRFQLALAAESESSGDLSRPPTSEFAELARWRRVAEAVFGDVAERHMGRLFQALWRHFAEPRHWRLYDDASPALTQLSQAGYQLGIASNFDGRLLNIAAGFPALAACQRIFVLQVGFAEPDPRFFAAVGYQLETEAAEILLVGVGWQTDIRRRRAGWKSLWLNQGNGRIKDSTAPCPPFSSGCSDSAQADFRYSVPEAWSVPARVAG